MKKAIKIILAVVGILVLLVVAIIAALPLWLGPVVKPVVNAAVPELTKTEFNLGHLSLNPYTGRFEIGDIYLANPQNYTEKCAAKLGLFVVDVDMGTLTEDVIHIEEVSISDLFVSVVYADRKMNFQQIQCNVTNSLKVASSSGDAAATPRQHAGAEPAKSDSAEAIEELNKAKVVIDRFSISGLKLSFGLITLPVPPITIRDIGKESNGATWAEVWAKVSESVLKASGAVGDAFGKMGTATLGAGLKALDVGKGALDTGKKGLDSAIESAKKLDVKTAEATLKETGAALKKSGDALKKSGDAIKKSSDVLKNASDDALKKSGDALKNVGDSLKGLLK